jgi:hypothetical protein
VERSTDNSVYTRTGNVTQTLRLNEQQTISFTDDIASVAQDVIYYRIKAVGKGGEVQYSNIIIIRQQQQNKPPLTISPNPAKNYATATFTADAASVATIRLINDDGKVVMLNQQKVVKGINSIPITGLDKYASGFYVVQVYFNNEVISQKLLILR